jgi:hypothetical protein
MQTTKAVFSILNELIVHANKNKQTKAQTNSVALVFERTIPTERPPLFGEVSANFFG